MGVAMMPIVFSIPNKHTYLLKLKNLCHKAKTNLKTASFSHFTAIFSIFNLIFVDGEIIGKTLPLLNFKRPQVIDGEVGTPTCCRKGSLGISRQQLTPQNTDKYVRTSGTGPKLSKKILTEEKPTRNLKKT